MSATRHSNKELTPALAAAPIVMLIAMLALSVFLFGSDASYGANQIALVLATGIAALVRQRTGINWREAQEGIIDGIGVGLGPTLILLAVGMPIGTWILSGTVPTMIYYGVQILNPQIFYAASALICASIGARGLCDGVCEPQSHAAPLLGADAGAAARAHLRR